MKIPYKINTLQNYYKWENWLKENGYKPWQYQFQYNDPEGHHVWFWKSGCENIEIETHNKEVQDRILKFE